MRRMTRWGCMAALALTTLAAPAHAVSIGIGAFGGTAIPVLQDDNGPGPVFGIRAPVSILPILTVEPFFASTSGGDKDQDINGTTFTRSGIDVTSFGVNAALTFGSGLMLYPYAGIGSSKLKRGGLDQTDTAYDFGLGFAIKPPIAGLSVHLRGELDAAVDKDDSDVSRKWANVTLGVHYALFKFPPVP